MLDKNKSKDLIKFYSICKDLLDEKAKLASVPLGELEWYFNPLSDKHIDRYSTIFNTNFDIHKNYQDFVFARFTASLFNSGFRNYMTNDPQKFIELSKSLLGFKLNTIKYLKWEDYQNDVINNSSYPCINKITKEQNQEQIFRGVSDIVKYLQTNQFSHNNGSKPTSFDDYMMNVSNIVNTNSFKHIYGMGFALFSDAIKESGIIDLAKPDVHVIDVFNKAFGSKNEFVRPSKTIDLENILRVFYDISIATNESIYKIDKIIWMVAAKPGNDFYLHPMNTSTVNFKQKLLNSMP